MKKCWTVFAAVVFISFLAGLIHDSEMLAARCHAAGGAAAADFRLADLYGNKVRLSDYFGRNPVLLVFGTTWCPYCRKQVPLINDIYSKYRDKGLVVLGVDINEPVDRVMNFTKQYKVAYPVLLDSDARVSRQYKIVGVPASVLIARDGSIVCNPCRSVEKLVPSVLK